MPARSTLPFALMTLFGWIAPSFGDAPPSVPATRAELKRFLEDSKANQPRIPLPPLTAEEQEKMNRGDWSVANNGRTRKAYLPPEIAGVGFLKVNDPTITLDYPFQTMLFWIVSRGNNCTYCMGHQESKLAAAGLNDDAIAALDGDWAAFSPKQRAAFALARKLTLTPQSVNPLDVEGLRSFYSNSEITQILLFVANFNAMNRWTGALKIPQEHHREYLTPTSPAYKDAVSLVAPLDPNRPKTGPSCAGLSRRPPLETPEEVARALEACRTRTAILPLVECLKISQPTASGAGTESVLTTPPQWVGLLVQFGQAGDARIALHKATETKGSLDPRFKAEIAYTAARLDRAWYALGHARRRLSALGFTPDRIDALDGSLDSFELEEAAVLALARKLTANPALIDDADIAALRSKMDDKKVAEVVHQVTEAAFFDRLTEAARLRLED